MGRRNGGREGGSVQAERTEERGDGRMKGGRTVGWRKGGRSDEEGVVVL